VSDIEDFARRVAAQRGEMMALMDSRAGWSRKELLGEVYRLEEAQRQLLGRVGELVMQNNELIGRLPLAERTAMLFPKSAQGEPRAD